ncbi:hypothetical protein BGW42_002648 [Actinomortierella wolfii]|nr:hypothetical protein BGW42_002648 [Actinomortierella wolfii]
MPLTPGRGVLPPNQQQYGQHGGNQGYGQQYGGNGGYGDYGQQQRQGYFNQQQPYSQNQPIRQYQQHQQYNQYHPQQQYTPSSSYSSRSSNRSQGLRPPDLLPQSLSASSNATTHSSSTSSNNSSSNVGSARSPTSPYSQQQPNQRQQQSLRTNRGFASPEPSPTGPAQGQQPQQATSSATTTGYGTSLWNKMLAAKEALNATISGEERWPDSDDSDYEGESHVARVLREYAEKKEEAAVAEQIAQMELSQQQYDGSGSIGSASGAKNQSLRDALRKDHSSFASSNASGDDYYSRSLRSRGMDDRDSNQSGSSGGGSGVGINLMNRFRAASDASRSDALNKLEGRGQGDAFQAQVSHLGSTSPRGQRGGGRGLSPTSAGDDRYGANSPSSGSYSSTSNSLREAYQSRNRSNTTQHQHYGSSGKYF